MLPDWSTSIRQVYAPAARVTTALRVLKSSLAVTSIVNSPLPVWTVSSSTTHQSLSDETFQRTVSALSDTATCAVWLELVIPRVASQPGVSTISSLSGPDVPSSEEQAAKTTVAAARSRKNIFFIGSFRYLRLLVWSAHHTLVVMLFVPPSQPLTASE